MSMVMQMNDIPADFMLTALPPRKQNQQSAASDLGIVDSHHRDVKPLALFWSCYAGQSDRLLQLLHGRTELWAAQCGLRPKTSFQRQTESTLTQRTLAVL